MEKFSNLPMLVQPINDVLGLDHRVSDSLSPTLFVLTPVFWINTADLNFSLKNVDQVF